MGNRETGNGLAESGVAPRPQMGTTGQTDGWTSGFLNIQSCITHTRKTKRLNKKRNSDSPPMMTMKVMKVMKVMEVT